MKWLIALGILLLVVLGVVLLEPTGTVVGMLQGDKFYRNRPSRYWKKALGDTDPAVHAVAQSSLKEGGADAVPVLIEIFEDKSGSEWVTVPVRCKAGGVLGQLGSDAEPAVPALTKGLKDEHPHVRAVAITSLAAIGPTASNEAVLGLISLLETEHRQAAVRALSRFGEQAVPAIPRVVGLLKDPDPGVRWNAARALGKLGPLAKDLVPQLVDTLKDEDPVVREHAAEALGDIGPPAAQGVDALIAALDDKADKVRRDAARSLGQIGSAAKPAVPALNRLLKDPNKEVQAAAEKALQRIKAS